MFGQFFNALTGAATNAANTLPAANGIDNVPIGKTFKNFFGTLVNSISPLPTPGALYPGQGAASFGGLQGGQAGLIGQGGIGGAGFGGTSFGAVQAFRNAQGQFVGGLQGFPGGKRNKNIRAQALAPGAVLVNSPSGVISPPAQQGFSQNQFALNPLQGFAGQGGANSFQPAFSSGPLGQQQLFLPQNGFQQGGLGKVTFLLAPVIGLFTLFKSLFDIRRTIGALTPVKVNREDFNLYGYQEQVREYEREEGSFDEFYPEELEQNNGFDISKLDSF